MIRLVFEKAGNPLEVLELREGAAASPSPAEAAHSRVRVLLTPVNPADFNFIQGTYGKLPQLPAVPGMEGVGRIMESTTLAEGTLVLLPPGPGLWQSEMMAKDEDLLALPDAIDPEQAAQLRVNPLTALLLLREFVQLQAGDWLIQNAANSAVGCAVRQLAALEDWRCINLCRDPARLGPDESGLILADQADAAERVREVLGDAKPRLALNAVGGESATRMAGLLAADAPLVTYGAMSRKALKIPNSFLIFRNLRFEGFWLSRWIRQAPPEEVRSLLSELAGRMARAELGLPVDTVYSWEDWRAALEHAAREGRSGKILLRWSE